MPVLARHIEDDDRLVGRDLWGLRRDSVGVAFEPPLSLDSAWEEPASAPSPLPVESHQHRQESIMNRMCIAIVSLMSVSTAPFAQGAVSSVEVSHQEIEKAAAASMSIYPADH